MKRVSAIMLIAVIATAPLTSAPAEAQRHRSDRDYRWDGDRRGWEPSKTYRPGKHRERRLTRKDRIYKGRDGRAYCRRDDGTTGLVVGALGGGVLANLVGGGTLGTLAGGVGGALLGRAIDRGEIKCR